MLGQKSILYIVCLITCLCASGLTEVSGTSYDQADDLHTAALRGYNTHLLPVRNQTDILNVDVSLNVVAINDFDEIQGYISVTGYLTMNWIDEIIGWDPNSYGGRRTIVVPPDVVWRPAIFLMLPVDVFEEFGNGQSNVRIDYTGHASSMLGGIIKSTCSANVKYFPFDTQNCTVIFVAWGRTPDEIRLNSSLETVTQNYFQSNGEWNLEDTFATAIISDQNVAAIFEFILKRRPHFFIINTLLPILVLGMLNPLVFLLPVESGERISFVITTLLSFIVFLIMVGDNMPRTSQPIPFLTYYVMLMLIYSTLICVTTIGAIRVYHNEGVRPVPARVVTVMRALR
jgi:nicotinic acetylcholine receptor